LIEERHITVDTVPPVLRLVTPENGSTTPNRYAAFNGTVDRDAHLSIGDRDCPLDDGRFFVIVPLAEGNNSVLVRAVDAAGNVNASVVRIVSDTTAPAINILSPADGSVVSQRTVRVSGETDGQSIVVGGTAAVLDGSRFGVDVALREGENAIDVSAKDIAGNVNLTTLHIVLDTRAPLLQITSPVPGHITNMASLSIFGATEPGAAVTVNDQPAANSNGSVSMTMKLAPGDNFLVIRAQDPAGNPAFVNRTVVLDQTPPPLAITEPRAGLRTSEGRMTVKGTTDPGCAVSVNGESATVDRKGKFSKDVSLEEGDNTLVVTAIDQGGNPTTRLVRVVRTGALSMKESETPALLAGLALGALAGAAVGFLAAARRRRRQAVHAAPQEPVPGGHDVPERSDADAMEWSGPGRHSREAPGRGPALPLVPEAEPLEELRMQEPPRHRRRGPGMDGRYYSRESPKRSR
jgi:hypothetical protein